MSLLSARDLSLSFGGRVLFHNATFALGAQDRVGLIGPNGSGKSTLMKMLAGQATPDSGAIQLTRNARVGYLPQELSELPAGRLLEAVLGAVPGRAPLEERLASAEQALSEAREEAEQLEHATRVADLREALLHFDERFGPAQAERILGGLGFKPADMERPTSAFSGGWRMRAALASLLLTDPDLLLLDEPTNHLDIPTLAWFDAFLRRSKRALLLVSHDRDFLNRQIGRVLSLEPEGVRSYAGDFDAYRRQRALEAEQLESAAERQAKKRAQLQAFVDRFGAKATKARQARSVEKRLAKEEIIQVQQERRTVSFRFPEVPRSGRDVVKVEHLRKRFGENVIFPDLSLRVDRGERIAIIGANGAGKTTLLRMLAGELTADGGEIVLGHQVSVGYYAQHHAEQLDTRRTILEEISQLVPQMPQSQVRGILGAFLFSGDDVEKPIGVLSGGERARVALARLLVLPSNLMLMDEPTNHLDLDSSEALIEALRDYEGTLIFVSHNRSFINQLSTRVWDVGGGTVAEFPGNLDDWMHHKALEASQQEGEEERGTAAGERGKAADNPKERRRLEAEARQARAAKEKPLKTEIARLEKRIADLEEQSRVAQAALADPELYADFARARPHMEAHQNATAELEELYERWTEVQAKLEELQGEAASA